MFKSIAPDHRFDMNSSFKVIFIKIYIIVFIAQILTFKELQLSGLNSPWTILYILEQKNWKKLSWLYLKLQYYFYSLQKQLPWLEQKLKWYFYSLTKRLHWIVINPIQDGTIQGCSWMAGPASLKSVTHIVQRETWHSYTLPKDPKIYESRDPTLEFYWHQRFFNGYQQILPYQEIQITIAFWYIISKHFNFFWVFKDFFNKYG